MIPRLLRSMLALGLLVVSCSTASAQSTWTGLGVGGNWSTSGNWDTPPTVGGSLTEMIILSGTTNTTTTMNLGTGPNSIFQLNSLSVDSNAALGFSVTGGTFEFAGSSPALLTINGAPGVTLTLNPNVIFTTNTTIDITSNSGGVIRELAFLGALSGAGNLLITSAGASSTGREVAIASSNNTLTGSVEVQFGRLDLLAVNALGRSAPVNLTGGNLVLFNAVIDARHPVPVGGFSQQIASLAGTSAASRVEFATAFSPALMMGGSNATTSYAGTWLMNDVGSALIKVGTGDFSYTGSSTFAFNGTLSVRAGGFLLGGTSNNAGGINPAGAGSINISEGAAIVQTMTGTGSNGRIGSNLAFTLNGGQYRLNAFGLGASSTGFSEVVGGLTVGHGESNIRIDTATGRGARLSFASLTNGGNLGTLFFQSGNLGTTVLNTAGSGNVFFNASITSQLIGTTTTYGPSTLDLAILPYGFAAATATGNPATFVTYDSTNGSIRGLESGNYDADFTVATRNVNLSSATVAANTLGANATTNALRTSGTTSFDLALGTNDLVITSGALLDTNTGGTNVTGSTGRLRFGSAGTLTGYLTTTSSFDVFTGIDASNLVVSGPGTVNVRGNVMLGNGATVAVNSGTFQIASTASITAANGNLTYKVARGANLSVPAGGLTIGANQTLRGSGTISGTVTIANDGRIDPNALNGPGLLNVNNLTLQGGSILTWTVSSALTDTNFDSLYTSSKILGTGTLNLLGASSGNRIEIDVLPLTLQGTSAPIYDLGFQATWRIAEFNSVLGFSPDKFAFLDSSSQIDESLLSVTNVGGSLYVVYAVPEPATVLGLASLGFLGTRVLRRRMLQLTRKPQLGT